MSALFVTKIDGTPIFASPAFQGASNDQQLWNACGLRARFLGKPYGIVGDKMFTFNPEGTSQQQQIIGVVPTKRKKGEKKLSEDAKKRNSQIGSTRVGIEHFFAQLKSWRIFKDVFRSHSLLKEDGMSYNLLLSVGLKLTHIQRSRLSPLQLQDLYRHE